VTSWRVRAATVGNKNRKSLHNFGGELLEINLSGNLSKMSGRSSLLNGFLLLPHQFKFSVHHHPVTGKGQPALRPYKLLCPDRGSFPDATEYDAYCKGESLCQMKVDAG
jgi:hypothetical protein